MAKTIKFNLICDDKPVRTIEDLQNNFSIEDVLAYYNNRLLHRWLEVRDYSEELKKVKAITAENPIEVIKELITIFNVVSDDKKIEESIYMLEYIEKRKELYSMYEKENYDTKSVIDNYLKGYEELVDGILNNLSDIAKIKANIAEIVSNYACILKFNYRELFYLLRNRSLLAIMCLLMNEHSRKYYLPIPIKKDSSDTSNGSKTENENEAVQYDTEYDPDKRNMYKSICYMIENNDLEKELGENLITFSGITDGYWKDLEPKGKKFMIINMGAGDFVRSAGVSGGDLDSGDISNKFVIVDGIDYKSNSASRKLLYMEV